MLPLVRLQNLEKPPPISDNTCAPVLVLTTLLSLTKKASVSLEAAKPVNVILLDVIFDKPEIELANAKVMHLYQKQLP